MEECEIESRIPLVTDDQSSKRTQPGKGTLHNPSSPVSSQFPTILARCSSPIRSMRRDQLDAPLSQARSKWVAVVGFVADHPRRSRTGASTATTWDSDCGQRLIHECHLGWRRRGDGDSQRNTLAVDHHHTLRALTPLGFPDFRAPFFAGAKLASMKVFSHDSRPRLSSCPRKARQMRSHTPPSSHSFSRLQHVAGLGYSGGRSRHRAPVFKTHRIPSSTARSSHRGRPPSGRAASGGSRGAMASHCLSVRRTPERANSNPFSTSAPLATPARPA